MIDLSPCFISLSENRYERFRSFVVARVSEHANKAEQELESDRRLCYVFNKDILASIDLILDYKRNMDFDSFRSDIKTVDVVVRNCEMIGEAARI